MNKGRKISSGKYHANRKTKKYEKKIQERVVTIKETKGGDEFSLHATCSGDTLDLKRQNSKVDAKAITLHQFSVKQEKGIWKARVIVDI